MIGRLLRIALVASALGLAGCATVVDYEQPRGANDPLESVNRAIFGFNEVLDEAVLKPVARGYEFAVPELVRWMVSNAFANLADLNTAGNQLLQGKPLLAGSDALRFGINTVFGFAGIADVASELGLPRHREDFGQTLGVWGINSGPYLVLPVLGPSTVRDGFGFYVVDTLADPIRGIPSAGQRNNARALRAVDTRAGLLKAVNVIDGIALDKYLFVRDGYLQRRRNLIWDGNPPEYETDD